MQEIELSKDSFQNYGKIYFNVINIYFVFKHPFVQSALILCSYGIKYPPFIELLSV